MTADGLDDFIRSGIPAADIPQERMERVSAAVFASLDAQQRRRRRSWFFDLSSLIGRYAFPMVTAAVVGIVIGQNALATVEVLRLNGLIDPASSVMDGF